MTTMNLEPQVPEPQALKRWMKEAFSALFSNPIATLLASAALGGFDLVGSALLSHAHPLPASLLTPTLGVAAAILSAVLAVCTETRSLNPLAFLAAQPLLKTAAAFGLLQALLSAALYFLVLLSGVEPVRGSTSAIHSSLNLLIGVSIVGAWIALPLYLNRAPGILVSFRLSRTAFDRTRIAVGPAALCFAAHLLDPITESNHFLQAPLLLYCSMVMQKGYRDIFRDQPPPRTVDEAAPSLARDPA